MTMHCNVDDDKGWRKLFDGLLDRSKLQTHVSQDTPPTMPACVTTMVMMMMVVVINMTIMHSMCVPCYFKLLMCFA